MNRDEYRFAFNRMRYCRRRVHLSYESDNRFYSRNLMGGGTYRDAINNSYAASVSACPTGDTRPWNGSMLAQFPHWQARRSAYWTKRHTQ